MKKSHCLWKIWGILTLFLLMTVAASPVQRKASGVQNLIPNPEFLLDADQDGCPDGWKHGVSSADDLSPSRFGWGDYGGPGEKAIWVEGGADREGIWSCEISGLEQEKDYLLTFWAYRRFFLNKIYPEVAIMGQNFRLDNHCTARGWQYFQIPVRSPLGMSTTNLKFINLYPVRFYFSQPRLILADKGKVKPIAPLPEIVPSNFFPIGIYGASLEDLKKIKNAGFNTVILSPKEDAVHAAHESGLKVILSTCRNENHSSVVQAFSDHPALLAWYIADEPEIKSITPEILRLKLDQQMRYDSKHPSCMAVVRSRFVKYYKDSCHVFMLDQYPIPHQPITWLSDSLDEAQKEVGAQRTWAVIQAFGGKEYAEHGWPLFPSFNDIRTLSYLAAVHKAQGLFFYTYRSAGVFPERWETLKKVIGELNEIYEWLCQPPGKRDLDLKILSPYKADARGRPAIHYQWKRRGSEAILIMVNTIDKEAEISLNGLPDYINRASVMFEKRSIALKEGNLRDIFGPHQTHIYWIKGIIPESPRIFSKLSEFIDKFNAL